MSAGAFLAELRRRDIELRLIGGELRCSAPAGVLTPELREALRERKHELLEFLAAAHALAGQQRAVVPLQANGARAPVFAVPGHNGDVFCYRALAQHLGADQPFFGLQPLGLDGQGEPLTRIEDMAAYLAAQIRAFRPHGPYVIAGYCAGGSVAFELAQQLSRGGIEVGLLALFGSPYPAYFRWPTQLGLWLSQQRERLRFAGELASLPLSQSRRLLAERLRKHSDRRSAERAATMDPVLALRAKIERATLFAVRAYMPGYFAGRVCLFFPCAQWPSSAVAARRWRSVAQSSEEYFGPDGCTSHEMLREPHAALFAGLFARAIDS